MTIPLILPDWPAPAAVKACSTTRIGGVSGAPFDSLNLGDHVGDAPDAVTQNRRRLEQALGFKAPLSFLDQVHGTDVVTLSAPLPEPVRADGAVSRLAGLPCTVMTADCLPLLLCDKAGTVVAAAHAGWRGLCDGIIEQTVAVMDKPAPQLLAWLGPAIGPTAFEVGAEVREKFLSHDLAADCAFIPHNDRYLANLYQLACLRLEALGVTEIYGGDYCTYTMSEQFFSYRRDGQTGRMASLIWLEKP